jgi:cell wall-associated NlpC family hydrolase
MPASVPEKRYQFAREKGMQEPPDWNVGWVRWDKMWERAHDVLRYRGEGEGFSVTSKGVELTKGIGIAALGNFLEPKLKSANLDTKFSVIAHSDGFALVLRRHESNALKGQLVIARCKELIGTSYVFGSTDCSWLSMQGYDAVDVSLPHSSAAQAALDIMLRSERKLILPGDLLFYGNPVHHVAVFLDNDYGGRVIDEEPHSVTAPWGFVPGGCHIRPMSSGYFCEWPAVVKIGRVASVNGKPA